MLRPFSSMSDALRWAEVNVPNSDVSAVVLLNGRAVGFVFAQNEGACQGCRPEVSFLELPTCAL